MLPPKDSVIPISQTVVAPQPDQLAFPLTKDKFDLLQQGEISQDRESRNVALGVWTSTLVGIVAAAAGIDWNKPLSWISVSILAAIFLSSLACYCVFARRANKAKRSPTCARIKAEIETHFNGIEKK